MRLGVSIPVEEGLALDQLAGLAEAAERHGYEAVVAGEVAGPDVFALLTAIASRTERVTLGTGVVPLATRSPALLAMGFQSVASLAPGRVRNELWAEAAARGFDNPLDARSVAVAGFEKSLQTALNGTA